MEQTELLKMVVEYLKENGEQTEISDEDKIKAAYALNMCTVSVSQIIDYSDLNILEQEYEAILNKPAVDLPGRISRNCYFRNKFSN